jgi:type II secretory ATPase GspE/PulE/Tfp pilus assembly ATPase PilB-like protein
MTKAQMTKAAQGDDEARAKLIESFQGASEDTIIDLIENLIAAARRDAADDIHIDLIAEGMTDAAQMVKNEYL